VVKGCEAPEVILLRAIEPIEVYGYAAMGVSVEQVAAVEEQEEVEAEKYLKGIATQLGKSGINARPDIIHGKAAAALIDFVTKNEIDLVIIATHGRSGVSRWVWGSVADRLLRGVCSPVLMVRAPGCVPEV